MKFTVLDGSLNSVNSVAARNQYFLSSVYFKYIFYNFFIVLSVSSASENSYGCSLILDLHAFISQ